jgi:hypothetical protein
VPVTITVLMESFLGHWNEGHRLSQLSFWLRKTNQGLEPEKAPLAHFEEWLVV